MTIIGQKKRGPERRRGEGLCFGGQSPPQLRLLLFFSCYTTAMIHGTWKKSQLAPDPHRIKKSFCLTNQPIFFLFSKNYFNFEKKCNLIISGHLKSKWIQFKKPSATKKTHPKGSKSLWIHRPWNFISRICSKIKTRGACFSPSLESVLITLLH